MTASRLDRLRSRMKEQGLDGLMVSRPENRAYVSGFTGSAGVLLVTADKAYLATDFRYTEQATAQAPLFKVVRPEVSLGAEMANLCKEFGVNRLGFEGDFMTVDEFQQTQGLHEGRELVSATGLVEGLRLIKDEAEIQIMKKAGEIADQAWEALRPRIRAGVSERELAVELEYEMKRLGAEGIAFDFIVASGVRSSLPHGRASEKIVAEGDLITFDFGALYQGYCSDITRTVAVGRIDEKQKEIYEIVLEAQLRGVAACRPGITGAELDAVCRDYIREKGYAEAFGHGTGHGVGRMVHEGPRVSVRGQQDVLQPGMVVTVEPGIYLPGWGGVRIEDTVVVTESGCERLTTSPKDLLVL